jgi:hypothetical protein
MSSFDLGAKLVRWECITGQYASAFLVTISRRVSANLVIDPGAFLVIAMIFNPALILNIESNYL